MTNRIRFMRLPALVAFMLTLAVSIDASAAQRSFVSTGGFDTSTCSLSQPCRSFGKALTLTDPGGEIVVLDSGGYGVVTVAQDVSIISPAGVYAGISVFSGTDGITVASPAFKVVLRGLTINGQGGNNGIVIQSGQVHIESVVVSNMTQSGVRVESGSSVQVSSSTIRSNGSGAIVAPSSGVARVMVRDTEISNSGGTGISVSPGAGALALVTVERSNINRNNSGLVASAPGGTGTLVVTQSVVTENPNTGVAATGAGATVFIRESAVTRNGTGFSQGNSGTFHACGANLLVANSTAQVGAIDTSSCLDVAALSGPAGGDLAGSYPNPVIDIGAVTNSKLGASSVTSSKIASGAVGNSELASDSVSRGKIQGGYASGHIGIALGADACSDVTFVVTGAQPGDIPLFALQSGETLPPRMLILPLRTSAADNVVARVCNFAAIAQSFNVAVYILTIR